MMSSAMSSAYIFVLVLIAVLHLPAQAENGSLEDNTVGTKPEADLTQKSESSTGSEENTNVIPGQDVLSELIASYINEWKNYYKIPNTKRAPRTKRWAGMDKRPTYYNSYAPSTSYSRYRYPSNLMALLRGTKRGWSDEPIAGRWQYPSNLMVLLRGKKSVMEEGEGEEEDDDEPNALEKKEAAEVMKRIADGWRYFLESYAPDMSAKRSAFYGYDNEAGRGSMSRRPMGSRQFMVWNGGRYILG